jgi:hypothetical protein
MRPCEDLADAARRIRGLVETSVGPARQDAARLSVVADPARSRRAASASAARNAAVLSARFGWIPLFGGHVRRQLDAAEEARLVSERDWQDIRARARAASELMAAAREAAAAAGRAEARARKGGGMPDDLARRSAELCARSRFLGVTTATGLSHDLAPRVFALAEEAGAIARAWDGAMAPQVGAAPADAGPRTIPSNVPAV